MCIRGYAKGNPISCSTVRDLRMGGIGSGNSGKGSRDSFQ
jgi:hypothetical protein